MSLSKYSSVVSANLTCIWYLFVDPLIQCKSNWEAFRRSSKQTKSTKDHRAFQTHKIHSSACHFGRIYRPMYARLWYLNQTETLIGDKTLIRGILPIVEVCDSSFSKVVRNKFLPSDCITTTSRISAGGCYSSANVIKNHGRGR